MLPGLYVAVQEPPSDGDLNCNAYIVVYVTITIAVCAAGVTVT